MSSESAAPAEKRSFFSALAVYGERRALIMLALGFASGLPNLLIFDTLSAWLREAGLSLQVISVFSLATLAYSLKLLWAPLVDRTKIPWLNARLGHRRSWMLVAQVAIMIGLWLVAGGDPATSLGVMALLAVLVAFAGATQDIVIDAWRIEAAGETRQGALAAAYQWGYRIAIIVAGAVPLVLAEQYSWNVSYLVMAALMLIGVAGVLGAPRETEHQIRAIDLGNGEAAYDDGYALGDGSEPYAIAPAEDRQYDDASYRAAWANVAAEPTLPATRNQPLPAYPGGPLPGDLEQDEIGSEYPGGY